MISKNKLKYLSSLKIKKYRLKENLLLIEGSRLINESIKAHALIESIYYTKKFANNENNISLINVCEDKSIKLIEVSEKDINQLSDSINNQGIIAVINMPQKTEDYIYNHQLILDSISDPGNLGNIIRTADWFGLKNIYLSENSIDPYNSKVIRSAMGAHFYINIILIDIIQHMEILKKNNFNIIGADIIGKNLYSWDVPDKWALILGNEAHGISDKIRKFIDYNITIPKRGNIESLNVAMAGGIFLSHVKRNIKD